MDSERKSITIEYVKMYNNIVSWWLKLTGYDRFAINNNQIEEKSIGSVVYGAFVMIAANVLVLHIIYAGYMRDNFLYKEEVIIALQVGFIFTSFLVNITFSNRCNGADLLHHCIDIDMLLGARETKFMRDTLVKINRTLGLIIFNGQFGFGVVLFIAFDVEMDLHFSGSTYFILIFSIFYDNLFLLSQYSFVSMRVRYLNIAFMKASHVKIDYLPKIYLFNGIFWKDDFTDYVTFHKRAQLKHYILAFDKIYEHLRRLELTYRFTILFTFGCVLLNSILTIHTIFVVKEIEMLRKICITMFLILSWTLLAAVSQRTDIVLRQLEQTKVICVYAQLKPTNSDEVFKLTKHILKLVESKDARPSIYGIFKFDTGKVLRLAASTFVYITFLLQSRLLLHDDVEDNFKNSTFK